MRTLQEVDCKCLSFYFWLEAKLRLVLDNQKINVFQKRIFERSSVTVKVKVKGLRRRHYYMFNIDETTCVASLYQELCEEIQRRELKPGCGFFFLKKYKWITG